MAENYPLINGQFYEFARLVISIDGEEYVGITAINYGSELMPGEARGVGPQRLGRTLGEHKAEADMEMLEPSWQALLAKLGKGFGAKIFEISVSYSASGDLPVVTDVLKGVRITKPGAALAQGPDPAKRKIALDINDVDYSGLGSIVPDSIY
jgi:hypothetical protein